MQFMQVEGSLAEFGEAPVRSTPGSLPEEGYRTGRIFARPTPFCSCERPRCCDGPTAPLPAARRPPIGIACWWMLPSVNGWFCSPRSQPTCTVDGGPQVDGKTSRLGWGSAEVGGKRNQAGRSVG